MAGSGRELAGAAGSAQERLDHLGAPGITLVVRPVLPTAVARPLPRPLAERPTGALAAVKPGLLTGAAVGRRTSRQHFPSRVFWRPVQKVLEKKCQNFLSEILSEILSDFFSEFVGFFVGNFVAFFV